jgi:hypothetical protein
MTLFVRPRVLSTLKFAECVLAIVEQKFVVQWPCLRAIWSFECTEVCWVCGCCCGTKIWGSITLSARHLGFWVQLKFAECLAAIEGSGSNVRHPCCYLMLPLPRVWVATLFFRSTLECFDADLGYKYSYSQSCKDVWVTALGRWCHRSCVCRCVGVSLFSFSWGMFLVFSYVKMLVFLFHRWKTWWLW